MVGQYATAVPVGKVLDTYGPWSCSSLASIMFSVGYGLFAWQYSRTKEDITLTQPSSTALPVLILCFSFLGIGTVFSYFSMLFSATRTFEHCMGFASGTSLAIFGMSPLFLSLVATKYFADSDAGVKVVPFFVFMSILTGTVNFFGGLILPGPPKEGIPTEITSDEHLVGFDEVRYMDADETRSLLHGPPSGKSVAGAAIIPVQEPKRLSSAGLLGDPSFWILASAVSLLVGAAEMIKSNIGLIVLSLPATSSAQNISVQVQLIAVCDTITRLLIGPLADVTSPVALYSSDGVWSFPRKPYFTRVWFFASAAVLYVAAFIWPVVGIRSQEALWPLSISTGIVNGTIFTMLPSILSSIWGSQDQGRNFGFISYMCFIGTTAFSYLYAFVADSHTLRNDGCGDCFAGSLFLFYTAEKMELESIVIV
ncbi:uncharacterized protein FIBRA_00438 [Fibroporia radiculosa]|uniref:Nodulin-like domain-containing protein n=1 Tax=Fibroporia radiculosa TaxID=599839 RepID=J4I7X9_9APHY|nr:uncharacterized protein FIBRA_00438 [Fibroporia radiculosa]CCL98441.1 predicted protein [Fibroporia radiculosa]